MTMSETSEQFRQAVAAAATGSIAGLALRAGLPRDAIRNVLSGHDPRLSRAADIACALGLTFRIGAPPPQSAGSEESEYDRYKDTPGSASTPLEVRDDDPVDRQTAENAESHTVAVPDHRMAECLVVLCRHYKALGTDYAREHFVEDLLQAGGSGTRAQWARLIDQVWPRGNPIPGREPDLWRTDDFGNTMNREDHGNDESEYGWYINFVVPFRMGGSDEVSNMRPRRCMTGR